jgi:hypothetical protein
MTDAAVGSGSSLCVAIERYSSSPTDAAICKRCTMPKHARKSGGTRDLSIEVTSGAFIIGDILSDEYPLIRPSMPSTGCVERTLLSSIK